MMMRTVLILVLAGTLAGCATLAESRLNPFNWFGRDRGVVIDTKTGKPEDRRPLIDQVVSVAVERAPGGAVLRATGLPPTQGHWEGELVADPRDGNTLTFQFRAWGPPSPTRVSTPQSREVIVATFLSDQTLLGVRQIRVVASRNARAVRR